MEVRRPHAWVEMPNGTPQWSALVVEWRQRLDGEWEARTVVRTKSNAHGLFDALTLHWVAASRSRPLT